MPIVRSTTASQTRFDTKQNPEPELWLFLMKWIFEGSSLLPVSRIVLLLSIFTIDCIMYK